MQPRLLRLQLPLRLRPTLLLQLLPLPPTRLPLPQLL